MSNHPLAGHTSATTAWFGFLKTILVFGILTMILADRVEYPPTFDVNGIEVPWAIFVAPIALWFYHNERHVSLERPRTTFYAGLDLLASLIGTAIISVAALSWLPPVATILQGCHCPVAPYNLMTLAIVVSFLPLAWYDLLVNQFKRAEKGREGIAGGVADESATVPANTISQIALDPDSEERIATRQAILLWPKLEAYLAKK